MTEPYYADEHVTLYLGDCREITDWLDADVLVTDPPYGTHVGDGYLTESLGKRVGARDAHKTIRGDDDTVTRDVALKMWGERPAVVFGSALRTPPPGAVHHLAYVKPPDAGAIAARGGWRRDVESVYLVGRWRLGAPRRSSCLRTGARMMGGPVGLATRSGGHPHAKPIDVLSDLIDTTEGIIADPFAGSGSTLVAAKQLGRRAIGVEIEDRYCEIAARRLSQGVLDFGAAS